MGETGDPRENPPTGCIVRHDSHERKSRSDPAGNRISCDVTAVNSPGSQRSKRIGRLERGRAAITRLPQHPPLELNPNPRSPASCSCGSQHADVAHGLPDWTGAITSPQGGWDSRGGLLGVVVGVEGEVPGPTHADLLRAGVAPITTGHTVDCFNPPLSASLQKPTYPLSPTPRAREIPSVYRGFASNPRLKDGRAVALLTTESDGRLNIKPRKHRCGGESVTPGQVYKDPGAPLSQPSVRHLPPVAAATRLPTGEPYSIPGGVAPGFSHVGIVPDDAAGGRVFSGISRFPPPFPSGTVAYSPHSPYSLARRSSRPNLFTNLIP
ncbi:hypothetical protein PR048_031139 [Dryococelus australis]|uniref:Uncharacterized protein n=1 Tax=Dryococelus australis TaxID=614101 RepID=A0ABQ9G4D9_9NEOP|nr:hypothetical protein PR048_031139 [Dryococelus australis]